MDKNSTYIDLDNGIKLVIWTGWDEGKSYKMGEALNWWPKPERPGVGIDAVYVSIQARVEWFVAVSNGLVVETIPFTDYAAVTEDPIGEAHRYLERKWPKYPPARELWAEEIWAAREEQAGKIKKGFRRSTQLIVEVK